MYHSTNWFKMIKYSLWYECDFITSFKEWFVFQSMLYERYYMIEKEEWLQNDDETFQYDIWDNRKIFILEIISWLSMSVIDSAKNRLHKTSVKSAYHTEIAELALNYSFLSSNISKFTYWDQRLNKILLASFSSVKWNICKLHYHWVFLYS